MQLIVTTHSDVLVDGLTKVPEAVVVCEKRNGSTEMKRKTAAELAKGVKEDYGLGQIWRSGEIEAKSLVTVKVYVEGARDHNKALATRCRQNFSEFFRKAGFEGRMPGVVVSGGRHRAYDRFRTAHENAGVDEVAVLLVDSEAPVDYPWEGTSTGHEGDGWQRPPGASDDQLRVSDGSR